LSEDQRARGRKILNEISVQGITSSFTIEERRADYSGKRSTFYSATIGRKGAEGFRLDELPFVRSYLALHVVRAGYEDAFRRRVLPFDALCRLERDQIVAAYEEKLRACAAKLGPPADPEG
jgi:hypothetical protein